MSSTYLNHLPEDVLALILEYTGILWLHELLKTGNRLLSSKMLNSKAIISYSNLNYYGSPCNWSVSTINRLQGLKSLIIKRTYPRPLCGAPSASFLLNLPTSVTEIDIDGLDCLRLSSTSAKDHSDLVPFGFGAYPHLTSLALRYPQDLHIDESLVYDDPIEIWFRAELPFPPSLTKFELIWPSEDIMSKIVLLPATIRKLGFMIDEMAGISWIHQFPDLEELTIDSMQQLRLSDQEIDLEVVTTHQALKLVRFELLRILEPPESIPALFAHFVNLETLSIPSMTFPHLHLSVLKNLRCLSGFSSSSYSEPLNEDILNCDWYSSKLVEYHCSSSVDRSIMQKLQRLPLTTFSQIFGKMAFESMKLLPKSLTRLTISALAATIQQIGETFPALGYLRVGKFDAPFHPSDLAYGGPNFSVCLIEDVTYVRVQDKSLSLDGECGWTSFLHAATQLDFESMDKILQVPVAQTYSWLYSLARNCSLNHTVSLEVFEWLRLRGLLAVPHRAGSLLFSPLFELALDAKDTSLVKWALEQLTDGEWTLMAGHIVGLLVQHEEYELLYSIEGKMDINASPPHTRVALAKIINNTFRDGKDRHSMVMWLVEHGHATLHLNDLISLVGRDRDGTFTQWVFDLLRLITSPSDSRLHDKSNELPSSSSNVSAKQKWGDLTIPVFGASSFELLADPILPPTSADIFLAVYQFDLFGCYQSSALEFLDCLIQLFGMDPNETGEAHFMSEVLIRKIIQSPKTPEIDNWLLEATAWCMARDVRFVSSVSYSGSIAHASARRGLVPLIHLLIDYGVDFEEVNDENQTAFDLMPAT